MSHRRRVCWRTPTKAPVEVAAASVAGGGGGAGRSSLRSPALVALVRRTGVPVLEGARDARDTAIGLLQLAAELEHALMLQYLYAAWSVVDQGEGGTVRATLIAVAVEEMAHLATVQNVLVALGGPAAVHFQRDMLRRTSDQDPMPFVLEPLDFAAIAKFVAVERPLEVPAPLAARVAALVAVAEDEAGEALKRVGVIYALVRWMFSDEGTSPELDDLVAEQAPELGRLRDADLRPEEEVRPFLASRAEWRMTPPTFRFYDDVTTRSGAAAALERVAAQGEGLLDDDDERSHFERFLALADVVEGGAVPVIAGARSPTSGAHGPDDGTVLEDEYTRLWGAISNGQYTLLVLSLHHTFVTARRAPPDPNPRRELARHAVARMRRVFAELAAVLFALPVRTGAPDLAGPSFDLDPVVLDPAPPEDLVSRHRDLLGALEALYLDVERHPGCTELHRNVVANLRSADAEHRAVVDALALPRDPE